MELKQENMSETVILDVGGDRFVTKRQTLLNVPHTRLSNLVSESSPGSQPQDFFFDRNPFLFGRILDYYRTGDLHLPQEPCGRTIQGELEFWGLDETCIAKCCWTNFARSIASIEVQKKIAREFRALADECYPSSASQGKRQMIWNLMSNPSSSIWAKVYAIVTNAVIFLSLVMLMVGTLPALQPLTTVGTSPSGCIMYADLALTILFTLEFIVRLGSSPGKCKFLISFSTLCDVLYVLPVLLFHILVVADRETTTVILSPRFAAFLLCAFVSRVLRLHRLVYCFHSVKVLLLALRASLRDLLLVVILIVLTAVFYAFVIFYVEISPQYSAFSDVPKGLWWAIITMTTVGYGDVLPDTPLGYVFGGLCACTGVILISLPVPLLARNISLYYAYREEPNTPSAAGKWKGRQEPMLKPEKQVLT